MKRAAIFLVAMSVIAGDWTPGSLRVAQAQGVGLETEFPAAPLELVTSTGRHAFTVEVARTSRQRAQGLMFRRSLAENRGMLFVYPTSHVIGMWMRNTYIPLDMIFLDDGGKVVSYHERAVPESLRTITSGVAASAVLEVPGGTVERLGVRRGDRVVSPALRGG